MRHSHKAPAAVSAWALLLKQVWQRQPIIWYEVTNTRKEASISIHALSWKKILNPAKEESIRHNFLSTLMIASPKARIWLHEQHLISWFPNYKPSVFTLYYLVRSYIPCCCSEHWKQLSYSQSLPKWSN